MGTQFHGPSGRRHESEPSTCTWNLGGMTPPKVLEFLNNFWRHTDLACAIVVHIQEIIVDVGIAFDDDGKLS